MKISHVTIKNYRNIQMIDIDLGDSVTLIGENNSGKSNFLKAVTLPFITDDFGFLGKNLSWVDINNRAKDEYYSYIIANQNKLIDGSVSCEDFVQHLPVVTVEVRFMPDAEDTYFVKDLCCEIENENINYGLRYEYRPVKTKELHEMVMSILRAEALDRSKIEQVKRNLLPTEYYSYSITVPNKGSVPYDTLKLYKYTSLEAERDDFSKSKERLGSKALVGLLQKSLTNADKLKVEKEYVHFFDELKSVSKMDSIINWQEESELKEAQDFFQHITILPNMPPMKSILSSIRLGYAGSELSLQGLGYRNLVLLFVLVNSLIDRKDDQALTVLTIEEPEAHLCINNIRLMVSFLKYFISHNTSTQLFYSTHSTEFVNKMDLRNIVVMHNGKAFSLIQELGEQGCNYLTKNPNTDVFKLFSSQKCILCEGISEEMLIRSYIDSREELSDVDVLSFHKGFMKIIEVWRKINAGTDNKLGIIRDYDDQIKAKEDHECLSDEKHICIRTTTEYTLEPEIVATGDNYNILKDKYGIKFGWKDMTKKEMQEDWRGAKAENMLTICKDIREGNIVLQMPQHIQDVLDFLAT